MQGIIYAILAALLFGVSTPVAKWLIHDIHPLLLAGLLYLGSGIGLGISLLSRQLIWQRTSLAWPRGRELLPLLLAIALGGVVAPVLLMYGLRYTPASSGALLLNLESVFTALLAWMVFGENADRRIVIGMAAIVIGSSVLSWSADTSLRLSTDALLIVAACACWAADNNLTRKVSHGDAMLLACIKGMVAGVVNLVLYWTWMHPAPVNASLILAAMGMGWLGYGISLSLFVLALRHLGAARTGAYFSIAPFVGAATAVVFLHEPLTLQILAAAALMGCGVWLHLTEHHDHEHAHEFLEHQHAHTHDLHHQHQHAFPWQGEEPHSHMHQHQPLIHCHPHYPDIHHRHEHSH